MQKDWICKPCNTLIFGKKSECLKCGTKRPNECENIIRFAHYFYDWKCTKCGDKIFGSKEFCLKCNIRNPTLPDDIHFKK